MRCEESSRDSEDSGNQTSELWSGVCCPGNPGRGTQQLLLPDIRKAGQEQAAQLPLKGQHPRDRDGAGMGRTGAHRNRV